VNQIARTTKKPGGLVGQIPANLAHPQSIRSRCDAGDLHLGTGQLDEEEYDEPLQRSRGPHGDRDESEGIQGSRHLVDSLSPRAMPAEKDGADSSRSNFGTIRDPSLQHCRERLLSRIGPEALAPGHP
jgi:hypothetical protein